MLVELCLLVKSVWADSVLDQPLPLSYPLFAELDCLPHFLLFLRLFDLDSMLFLKLHSPIFLLHQRSLDFDFNDFQPRKEENAKEGFDGDGNYINCGVEDHHCHQQVPEEVK